MSYDEYKILYALSQGWSIGDLDDGEEVHLAAKSDHATYRLSFDALDSLERKRWIYNQGEYMLITPRGMKELQKHKRKHAEFLSFFPKEFK